MKHLIFAGAGGLGREMFWNAQLSYGFGETFDIKGYIVDDPDPMSERYQILQKPILGSIDDYEIQEDDVFICAIGTPKGREAVVKRLEKKGAEFLSLIHKTALIHEYTKQGAGIFVGPFTAIGDNATIGSHVILNTHSAIGHDAVIGDCVCVMSYVDITGGCQIGERVFLGSGCRMVPKTRVEKDAFIGAGSVVIRPVKEGKKVFGNPARVYDI